MAIESPYERHPRIVPETVDRLCFGPDVPGLWPTDSRFSAAGFHFPVFFERVHALRSGQRSEIGAVFLGRTQNVSLPGAESPIRLKALQGGMEIVPPQRRAGPHVEIQIGDYPLSAGLYAVLADKVSLGYLGVNISPEESASPPMALSSWEAAGLRTRIIAAEGSASEKKGWALRWRGWQLWALLAVALLILEAWWAKRLLRVPLPVGAAPAA